MDGWWWKKDGWKGIAKQRPERVSAQAGRMKSGRYAAIRLPRFLHGKYQPNQLFGGMGNGNIVVFALCAFLGEIGGESRVPVADVYGCIVKGVA